MMMLLWSTIIATLVGLASAVAVPRDSGFQVIPQAQVKKNDAYAHYAAAATCSQTSLAYWNCGTHCQATPNFEIYTSGGNGTDTLPFWYVGYDNAMDSIMLVHQGPDEHNFFTNLANANNALTSLDPNMFPNISKTVQVNEAFAIAHAESAWNVMGAVSNLVQKYPYSPVTCVGFSLGGAIALLDALLLRMIGSQIGLTADIRVVTYGIPRVGNNQFAGFVDAMSLQVNNIVNGRDPVPVVPAMSLGYSGVSGEIHIQDSGAWIKCPGEDNGDPRCIAGTVTSISNANYANHVGPYDGIYINCNS